MSKLRLAATVGMVWVGSIGAGCTYTISFEPADVINNAIDEEHGHPLEVDILCLTDKDLDEYPLLTCTAADWFKDGGKKEEYGQLLALHGRLYSFQDDKSKDLDLDHWLGQALRGTIHEKPPGPVKVHHKAPFKRESAILLFPKYWDSEGNIKRAREILQPPSKYKPSFTIGIGKDRLNVPR